MSTGSSHDKRIALSAGYKLTLIEKVPESECSNTYKVIIQKEIARGGSCLVYKGQLLKAVRDKSVTQDVIVKEVYHNTLVPGNPEISISRDNDFKLKFSSEKAKDSYEDYIDHFCAGQINHIVYSNYHPDNALPSLCCSGFSPETGAFYAVSQSKDGQVLSRLNLEDYSLVEALELCKSICEAIGKVHHEVPENENIENSQMTHNLYLDCKPDNIFVINNRAYLFDFDTLQSVPMRSFKFCSYSKGWSAPEQEIVDEKGYKDPKKIGYHTDIFSIGAVLFYLLTGKSPFDEGFDLTENSFDWKKKVILKDKTRALEDDDFVYKLDQLMREVLEKDPDVRKIHYRDVNATIAFIDKLNILIDRANTITQKTGFEDTKQSIDDTKEELKKSIEENSVKKSLFGTKKRLFITALVLVFIIFAIGVVVALTAKTMDAVIPTQKTIRKEPTETESTQKSEEQGTDVSDSEEINSGLDLNSDHYILLKLANANHQYEVGIENWKRLDYVRAERDFLAVRDEKSNESSQAEVEVAKINNSLGCLYLDMGRYNEAYDYLNSAFVTFRDHYGEDSVEARAVRASIAQYYYFTGKSDEALRETQFILDKSDVRNEKVVMASTMHLRAMIFDAQGHYDDALSLYNSVLDMYSDISANGVLREQLANYANDPNLNQDQKDYYTNSLRWIILTYNNLSSVNIHKGDYKEAISAANIGIEMSLSNVYIGKRNLTTSKLYMNLAIAEGKCGDVNQALDDIDLSMRIQRNLFDFQDVYPGLVTVYDVYGDLLLISSRSKEAEEYYLNAVTLAKDSFGENHPITAEAYYSLGKYFTDVDINKSIEHLKKAIEIRKNVLSENHPDTAKMYYELAIAQRKHGDEEAGVSLSKAKDICDKWEVEGELRAKIIEALG